MKKRFANILHTSFQFIRKHWKIIAILTILVILVIWFYFRNQAKNELKLTFAKPQIEDLTKVLEVSGVVDAKQKARLRFIAGGKIVYLGAHEGDLVKKWQTIATIDGATLKKQLEQDLNLYMKERWDFEQSKDDTGNYDLLPITTRRTRDQEQWDLENEVLDVEIRDIAIRNTALTAPFDGILTVSPITNPGVQVLSTDYFEVVDPTTLIFRGQVDEADIAQINLSQTATIELDAYENEVFNSTVNFIAYSSSASSTGTVFLVEFPLQGNLDKFRLGMNGDVAIKIDSRNQVISIPFVATRERDGHVYVDVRTGDKTYEQREIKVGMETEEKVEVLEGLSLDDEILIPE